MSRSRGEGDSEAGRSSSANEDSFSINDSIGMYVVSDGASTTNAGEIASRLAVEAVNDFVEEFEGIVRSGSVSDTFAAQAVQYAFNRVYESSSERDVFGMSATLTLVLVGSGRAAVGHVGDSRLYLVRDDELHQLTLDHPLSDAVETNGVEAQVSVDRFTILLREGDLLLLCTDGLNTVLEDEAFVVELARSDDLRFIVDSLLDREDDLGEGLDATAIAVRVEEDPEAIRLVHAVSHDLDLVGRVTVAA